MKILAIETSDTAGSLALLHQGVIEREIVLDPRSRSAQTLAPALDSLLKQTGWRPADIELVAVAVGPGSFTGLRVGVATAKTFAYVVGAEVVAVNTLEAIANQAPINSGRIWAVIDAQRQQVFAASFVRDGDNLISDEATRIVDNEHLLANLIVGDRVTGPGLRRLIQSLPDRVTAEAEEIWRPRAATVGQLGWRQYQAGQRDDIWRLAPQYFRRSAAEEKWDREQKYST